MAATYKVKLKDGVEVGPLDVPMLRSWYEQGMVGRDSPVRPTGHKKWVPLVNALDIGDWGASVSTRDGAGRGAAAADEDEEDGHPPQRWRAYVGALLLVTVAGAAGFVHFFPTRVIPGLRVAPWREIALGLLGVALLLATGRETLRKAGRILICALTFSLFPLAAFFIVPVVQVPPLLVLGAAWIMGSGLFFFVAGRYLPWTSVALSLLWVALGAAGAVYTGFVPPGAAVAAPLTRAVPLAPAVSVPASAVPSAAALALHEEVPLLSPRAAEAILTRAALAPDQGLKVAYASASRGLGALTPAEGEELGALTATTYGMLSEKGRTLVLAHLDRARKGEPTPLEEDRAVTALMRDAVLKLDPAQRERLQALFEKAIAAGG